MSTIYRFSTKLHFFDWIRGAHQRLTLTNEEKQAIRFVNFRAPGAPCEVLIESGGRLHQWIEKELAVPQRADYFGLRRSDLTVLPEPTISLADSFRMVRLEREDPRTDFLLLVEPAPGSSVWGDVLDHALGLRGWKFRFIDLVSSEDGSEGLPLRALWMERSDHSATRNPPPRFPGAEVYGLQFDGGSSSESRYWLPPGYYHPILRHYPFLRPSSEGAEGVWWLWRGDASTGAFVGFHVRNKFPEAQEIDHHLAFNPAMLVPDTGRRLPFTVPALDELERKIPLGIVPDERHLDRLDRDEVAGLLLMIETELNHFPPALFDVLDRVDCRMDEAWYYATQKDPEHQARNRLVRHLIRIDEPRTRKLREIIPVGARAFYQPASFRKKGINLFIPSGFRFKPDIARVLDQLSPDHPLVVQLADLAGGVHPQDPTHYLETTEGWEPEVRSVSGGRSLLECLKGVVSTRTEVSELLRDEWVEQAREKSEERTRFVEKAVDHESATMGRQFEQILAEFRRDLEPLGRRFTAVKERIDALDHVVTTLEGDADQAPERWQALVTRVRGLLGEVAEPRFEWLQAEEARLADESGLVEDVKRMNLETRKVVTRSVETTDKAIDTVESLATETDKLAKTLGSRVEKAAPLLTDVEAANTRGEQSLTRWEERIEAALKRLGVRRTALEARRDELEERRDRQEEEERALDELEESNSRLEEDLDEQAEALRVRTEELEAETRRLETIRDVDLPRQQAAVDRLQKTLDALIDLALEDSLRDASNQAAMLEDRLDDARKQQGTLEDLEQRNRQAQQRLDEEEEAISRRSAEIDAEVQRLRGLEESDLPARRQDLATLQGMLDELRDRKIEETIRELRERSGATEKEIRDVRNRTSELEDRRKALSQREDELSREVAERERVEKEVEKLERTIANLDSRKKIGSEVFEGLLERIRALEDTLRGSARSASRGRWFKWPFSRRDKS